MNNKRIFLGLGSVGAVLAIGGAALVSGVGLTQRSEVVYMTDGPTFKDVTDLTRASKAVAHVRILSAGPTFTIPFDRASAVVSARPSGNPDKDKEGQLNSSTPGGAAPTGLMKTDFTVEVLDNIHGAGLKKGDHIVVSQLGGSVATQRPDGVSTNVTVANSFQVQTGSFAVGANTLTVDGPFTVAAAGSFAPETGTVVFAGGTPQTLQAQGACSFTLGFKALRDQIPDAVGTCLENERFNPANGNSEQRTSGGLLVWRKADNWTAFTDGYQTWVNGPLGLQQRLNSQRFPWEANPLGLPNPVTPS